MNNIYKIILVLLLVSTGVFTYSMLDAEIPESDNSDSNNAGEKYDSTSSPEDDDDDDDIPSRMVDMEGQRAIRLDVALQKQSGIKTQILMPMDLYEELDAFGRVVNIQGLLELRSRLNKIEGEKNIVLSELAAANKTLNRLQILHREAANISTRQVQEAEAESSILKAKLNTLISKRDDLRTEAVQTWGAVLSGWVFDDQNDNFEKILSGEQVLLLVALSAKDTLPDNTGFVFIGRNGKRSEAQKAMYLSPAVESDQVLQGETYYFMAAAGGNQYRAAMHVHVWVPQSSATVSGVFVPDSAVVWSSGKPWVYLKSDEELFIKMAINKPLEMSDGLFVDSDLQAGEEVVISGAQMLLAEEYRWSIPDEDDNP